MVQTRICRVGIEKEDCGQTAIEIVGVDDGEGTPVPIPNTEVKLTGADDTWLATARESR